MRGFRRCVVSLVLLAVPAFASEQVAFISTRFTAYEVAEQVLDSADLRVLFPLGYVLSQAPGKLPTRLGLVESRTYVGSGANAQRTLELGIISGTDGTFDLALVGADDAGEGAGGNPDFPIIQRQLRRLVQRVESGRRHEKELGYEIFRLGHIEADRAIALLKALGYYTVEFEAKATRSETQETVFSLVHERQARLPWVVKIVNATKTSLLQNGSGSSSRSSSSSTRARSVQGAPQLGGSHLSGATGGAPEQRLLLVYDRNDPEALEELVNLLQTHVDVPAQQIVIEAQIIEVNTSKLRDMGFELTASQGSVQGSFQRTTSGASRIGTLLFSRDGFSDFASLRSSIEALTESGDAEILSSPSVLVLNDRQARIQVGRQIPVAKTTATTSVVTKGIEYFPVGIVLNLRPRINRDKTAVTMQIETIISSISAESAQRLQEDAGSGGISFSPIVDNRLVETFVRVADGTPFIIGGLLSTTQRESRVGVPLLSSLPVLGRLLSRERVQHEKQEVIVVITPHIVPLEEKSFSYLIPKDSDLLDRFDTRLFRNAYRVRDDDVWDSRFIVESPALVHTVQRVEAASETNVLLKRQPLFAGLLAGRIPGEGALVRRMLLEIIGRLEFHQEINLDRIFFFTPPDDPIRGQSFSDDLTLQDLLPQALSSPERAVLLRYQAHPKPLPGQSFSLPLATVKDTIIPPDQQTDVLFDLNVYDDQGQAQQWTIMLANNEDVERLRKALILKLVLSLNKNLEQSLQAFRPGVQILFPTREDMGSRFHLIDAQVAHLFYETRFPYQVAQRQLNATLARVQEVLDDEEQSGFLEAE